MASNRAFLLAIEGADGAGKATIAAATAALLNAEGVRAEVVSFPRYAATIGGGTLGDLLGGRLAVVASPETAAVLYALDRFESKGFLAEVAARCDVVVFDRYIASNIAYQVAKAPSDAAEALAGWIVALETGQFGLPPPDLSIYLDTPLDVARAQIAKKAARSYTTRTFDENEADDTLQRRVRETYTALVTTTTLGPWRRIEVVSAGGVRVPADLATEVVAAWRAAQAGDAPAAI